MIKQEYKYWTTTRETAEEYKYASFAMETASEYKYQIATETVEQNTSKQISAKETALQNVHKYSLLLLLLLFHFIFFLKWSQKSGMKIFQGCNGPSLEGYLSENCLLILWHVPVPSLVTIWSRCLYLHIPAI